MTGDDDENGPETDDPAEGGAFDPDVEIHAAMLARERAGGSYPDGILLGQVSISLGRNDWDQIIDGLEARRASWEVTARYLEGEAVDEAIEECRDAGEARSLVAAYERLIGELWSQLQS